MVFRAGVKLEHFSISNFMECGIKVKMRISFIQPVRRRKQNSHPQKVFKFKACMLELQGEKHLHFSSELITLDKV